MNGYEKAKQTAKEIGKENKKEEKKVEAEIKEVENALAKVHDNPEMAKLYKDNAEVGSENLVGELPLLKIHTTGRSSTNQLADGGEPNDGWFFYRPMAEQFQEIECHVLTISRGFRAEGMEGKKDVFNQILAGVITNNGDLKPFIMYFTGLKLSGMWEFAKEVRKYTKAVPVPIPMFALKIKMTTEKKSHTYGKSWVVNFKIIKDENDSPIVVTDPGLFTFLRDHVDSVEDTIASLIAVRSTEESGEVAGDSVENAEKVFGEDLPNF